MYYGLVKINSVGFSLRVYSAHINFYFYEYVNAFFSVLPHCKIIECKVYFAKMILMTQCFAKIKWIHIMHLNTVSPRTLCAV